MVESLQKLNGVLTERHEIMEGQIQKMHGQMGVRESIKGLEEEYQGVISVQGGMRKEMEKLSGLI